MAQYLKRLNLVSTFTVLRVCTLCVEPRLNINSCWTPISRAVQHFVQFGSRLHEVHIDSLSRKRPGHCLTRFNCNRYKSCVNHIKKFRPGANETSVMQFALWLSRSRFKLYNIQYELNGVSRMERIIREYLQMNKNVPFVFSFLFLGPV